LKGTFVSRYRVVAVLESGPAFHLNESRLKNPVWVLLARKGIALDGPPRSSSNPAL